MKKLIYIVFVAFIFISCDDFLDVDSPNSRETDNFYQTPTQAEQALLGIYNGLLPLPEYIMLMSDIRSDDVWSEPADDKQRDYVDISVFNPNIYTIGTINSMWNALFRIVARANLFIEKMENGEFTEKFDAEVKQTFIAEARFLRAYAYFDLVRYFGRVPLSLQSMTAEEAMNRRQSEAKEIYEEAIIPDLLFAIDNMQENALTASGTLAGAGRATRPAAQALLGRVYLTMAGFPLNETDKTALAAEQLKAVIDYANQSGRYWTKTGNEWPHIWISDNDNKYHIFEIQYVAQKNYGNPIVFNSVPNLGTEYVGIQMSGFKIYADQALKDLYAEYPDDPRYEATVDPTRFFFTKFFEHKIKRAALGYSDIDGQIVDRTYFPINYPLIRLEDVMLMYAEAVGATSDGIAQVNRIRTRAGLPELSEMEKTGDAFLKAVDSERRRELSFEGIRWHDIVRHNTYIDLIKAKFMRQATDETGAIVRPSYTKYIGNIQPGTYLFPIPDIQMKAKDGLYLQNEAYK